MSNWKTDWVAEWLSEWMTDGVSDWLKANPFHRGASLPKNILESASHLPGICVYLIWRKPLEIYKLLYTQRWRNREKLNLEKGTYQIGVQSKIEKMNVRRISPWSISCNNGSSKQKCTFFFNILLFMLF